ncbi:MAG: sigma 54-interacting transcriptional regulator [Candidatus Magnetomorum sp.]|nr:sigma 54-interacting transcriptional regulator [Candidatus Magnetomorum sp.]
MKEHFRLSDTDRNFFLLVDKAITTNPFSDQRRRVDLRIAGKSENLNIHKIEAAIKNVDTRIKELEHNGYSRIDQFCESDRKLMEHVYLFQFFYSFRDRFDQLILDQIKAGETSIPVPFAQQIYTFFKRKGFHSKTIHRYIAMCYQVRRAFYFINRTLIGSSGAMKTLRFQLWNNVFTGNIDLYDRYMWDRMEDFSTIILGETGTGKGTAAMAIGRSGYIPFDETSGCFAESFLKSFIAINLSQFPESLIESELFGYTKGAFTGAVKDHQGIFSRCSACGSIFLDEIGDVSIPIQIKLLQVLHERNFCAVGSHHVERFRGRVIAATNRSINKLRRENIFRDDFYYRLCSDVITVPSLRQRIAEDPKELDTLLSFTVNRIVGRPSPELTDMVKAVILKNLGIQYPWPGNVRELEQCVRNVIVGQDYKGDHKYTEPDALSQLVESIRKGELNTQSLIAGYCDYLYTHHQNYEKVARCLQVDSRTVKKYLTLFKKSKIHS